MSTQTNRTQTNRTNTTQRRQPLRSGAGVRPLSPAAKLALRYVGRKWQKVPHQIRAAHLAVLIRQGHIEHRWPFDLYTRMMTGSVPWLSEGEIRRRPNDKITQPGPVAPLAGRGTDRA